jgi:hypothetical protein
MGNISGSTPEYPPLFHGWIGLDGYLLFSWAIPGFDSLVILGSRQPSVRTTGGLVSKGGCHGASNWSEVEKPRG